MTSLSTDDRLALAELVQRYAALVDDRDPSGVAALFTDDGVLAAANPPVAMDPVQEHVGPAAITRAMAELDGLEATFHAVTGQVVDPGADRDSATGRVACLAHHATTTRNGETRDLLWAVTYRDAYRRTGAGWRFARRAVHVTFVATSPLRATRTTRATS